MAHNNEQFEAILKEVNSEVGDDKVETTEAQETVDTPYAHEKIMREEGITKNELPEDIRKMVITFERKLRMAKKNNSSQATMLKIQNLSTLIGDKIIDHLESDIPTKEDGGGIEGLDDMGIGGDDSSIDDLDDGVEDVDDIEIKEKGGLFSGVLGGILDW
jgi:hypothetical protein